jgi:hypothetical protein
MEPESPTNTVLSVSNDVLIDKYLQTVVEVICVSCFRKTKHFSDRTFLFYINKLIKAFESRELFMSLLKADVTLDTGTESKDSLVQLYDSTLHKWLQDEKICSGNLVDITFSLLKFLTADDKNHVLDALCKVLLFVCFFLYLKHAVLKTGFVSPQAKGRPNLRSSSGYRQSHLWDMRLALSSILLRLNIPFA